MSRADILIKDLPDAGAARRFLDDFTSRNPSQAAKLEKKEGLLSDVLTLASYSPLLATTLLQNPIYVNWLDPKRSSSGVRDKEALLESLARFSMTNSQVEPQVLLSRFRRRELLRIYLRDIRRLATIAEITEELSNLADSILEHALTLAAREMDNRFGQPLEIDEKGKAGPAAFSIFSLGKLGSRELNYSSDIDLLFVYSAEGSTSGSGARGAVTNREYFAKLAEFINKLIGQQTGEGAAYRVDMRLRPHGRIGALALSLDDTVRYYLTEARDWERQVLIRSRSSAGDGEIYKQFFARVEDAVFSKDETVENALRSVRRSKELIDKEHSNDKGYNVKLGRGGIREIEFLAQALQLAYGGHDRWLRVPHTLICLARLADRGLVTESELTELADAYDFLRRTEHILQMEHGLQTHTVPPDPEKRALLINKIAFAGFANFEDSLALYTGNVSRVFKRVFGDSSDETEPDEKLAEQRSTGPEIPASIKASIEKTPQPLDIDPAKAAVLNKLSDTSPYFAQIIAASPYLIEKLPTALNSLPERDYTKLFENITGDFARQISMLRRRWAASMMELVMLDIFDKITRTDVKRRQTRLAEASIEAALAITRSELALRNSVEIDELPFAILGLGKLGGRGMDYGSDLDLILVYDDEKPSPILSLSHAEVYGRAVEIFVNVLSGMTRDGSLYRVDLRLRPYGKNGTPSMSKRAFLDYLAEKAAIWEWLAYVKLRAVAGDMELATGVETAARSIIHEKAAVLENPSELPDETRRVRLQLEKTRGKVKGREIDIKFGEGGMLDIYFLMRYLQLRDSVADDKEDRSSRFMLGKLHDAGSLSAPDFEMLSSGYEFLSALDHQLRLTVGRSTRVPVANRAALEIVSQRMGADSPAAMLQDLHLHRLNIRSVFDQFLPNAG